MTHKRPSIDEYYLNIAAVVASRSTCLRRQYGAVIVKDNRIVSTGYNGAACGNPNCCDVGYCWRAENDIPHGERYEECKAVHAEANAIIKASPEEMDGATLYLSGFENGERMDCPNPCMMCGRLIANSGIDRVVW